MGSILQAQYSILNIAITGSGYNDNNA